MPLKTDIANKLARLETVPDKFISLVDRQNSKLFQEALKLLDALELKGGFVVPNEANLNVINQVSEIMKNTLFNGEYLEGVKSFVTEFQVQAGLNNSIISQQFNFKDKELFNSVVKQSQRTALQLLDQSAISNSVLKPLTDKLSTSVMTGAKYSDVIQMLKDNILGGDLDPKLTSHVSRYVRDAFATFDRTYTQIVANDVKVEFWEFSGGLVKDSRDFCVERDGQIFTTEEVESWADEDWQGKNPATDSTTIFAYLGGFQCLHSLIPRSSLE